MTICSMRGYVEAIRGRYLACSKKGKGELPGPVHYPSLERLVAIERRPAVCCIAGHRAGGWKTEAAEIYYSPLLVTRD